MSIWAEAYDLPHVASPGKKIAYIPVLNGRFGRHADPFREEGSVTVPTAWERLSSLLTVDPSNHANDVGSVVHFFQRGVLGDDDKPRAIGSFVAERQPDGLGSRATSTTQISGRGLTAYFLDRVSLWPFDHPNNPTQEGDWIFGGDNILTNPGLEDGSPGSEQFAVWMDSGVSSGQWRLDVDSQSTSNMDWDTTTTNIKDQIELDISTIADVSVTGQGTEDDPWVITVNDPIEAFEFEAVDVSLSGGGINSDRLRIGGSPEITGWTKSVNLARQSREHGRYASDGFRLTEEGEPVHSGDYALRVNGLERFAGAMQVLNVTPGHRYTASLWIYTSDADAIFRMVFRDRFERFIGGPDGLGGFQIPALTWTQITYEFTVPEDVTQLVFRIAVVGHAVEGPTTNPDPFYLDDFSFAPGTSATNVGDIWEQLLLDAQTDHDGEGRDALTYLTPTFTDTVDSAGVTWDADRKVTLQVDDTYGQIAESFQNLWGYVHRIYYDREDNTYYYEVFNPGYNEVDHSGTSTGTLVTGMNILGGEAVRRIPEATHFTARGDSGIWSESTDTDLLVAWGWADGKTERVSTPEITDLDAVVSQKLARNLERMFSFEAVMTNQGQVRPFHEIDILHKIGINLGAQSGFPFSDMVVTSIVTSFTPGQRPDYQVYVNSDAFASTGAAALAEAVRRLLRRTQKRTQEYGGLAGIGGGQGGVPRIVVAASNASPESQAKADFLCLGDDPDVFHAVASIFSDTVGGELRLTEGAFSPDGNGDITWSNVHITGAGRGVTEIFFGTDDWIFTGNSGMRFLSQGILGC